jgi:Tfp pilus assembly protein PilF
MTPQALQLLTLLVERPGQVVTRDEIRRALWSEDTFVDFDAAVNVCMSQIRGALGDKATAPRFIETLPRRGYRFVAPVEDGGGSIAGPALPDRPGPGPHPPDLPRGAGAGARSGRIAPVMIASTLLLAVTVLAIAAARHDVVTAPGAPIRSIEATQKFERGRSGLEDASPAELAARVKHFETAVRLDPQFAEAYAGLADAKLILAAYRAEEPQRAYAAAKAASAIALQLNPRLAEAHATYGAALLLFDWNWTEAGLRLKRAVALGPSSSRVHHWYARYLTATGNHDKALEHARRAVALAPGSPSALTYLGVAAFYAGRIDAAHEHCTKAAALMPEFTPAALCVAATRQPGTRSPATPDAYMASAITAIQAGDRRRALDVLQSAANRHSDALVFAAVHPALRPLHDEARFRDVVERTGRPAVTHTVR